LLITWIVVLAHGIVYAYMCLNETAKGRTVAIGLGLVASAGLLCRWGPLAACTLGGYYAGFFWVNYPRGYAHDAIEGLMQDFGSSVIGAIIGAIVGGWIELCKRTSRDDCSVGGLRR
jgi:hypothetical protein